MRRPVPETAPPDAGSRTIRVPCGCAVCPAPAVAAGAARRTWARRPHRTIRRPPREPGRAWTRGAGRHGHPHRRRRTAPPRAPASAHRGPAPSAPWSPARRFPARCRRRPIPQFSWARWAASPRQFSVYRSREQPGLAFTMARLERLDFVGVRQREADFVETVHQTVLGERVYFELEALAAGRRHRLVLEIHRKPVAFRPARFLEQTVDDL